MKQNENIQLGYLLDSPDCSHLKRCGRSAVSIKSAWSILIEAPCTPIMEDDNDEARRKIEELTGIKLYPQ